MAQIFPPVTNVLARLSIVGAAAGVPVLGAAAYFTNMSYATEVRVPKEQPIPFSHKHHVLDDGIDCRFCHTSVDKSSFAGMPTTHTCMTCHSQLWNDSPLLKPLLESHQKGIPVRWTRVHDLPDFVHFNHSIHLKKGVSCVECHGRIDEMPLVWKEKPLTMQWCLQCHRDPATKLRPREHVYDLGWTTSEDRQALGEKLMGEYHVLGPLQMTNCSLCHY